MKKILLALIIFILSIQTCFAIGESEEDIDSYFVEEPPNEQVTAPQTQMDTNGIQDVSLTTQGAQDSDNVELNGYLQFNEEQSEETDENAVHLEPIDTHSINFSAPKKVESKSLLTNKKASFRPIQDEMDAASKFSSKEYEIKPMSASFSQSVGKFSFGTNYDSYLDSASSSYSTSVFSKFDGKHFSVGTAFSKSTNLNDENFSSKIYFMPELKLTKRLSLLDVMQTDMNQINKKNEIVLRYTPHFKKYADDVQFEVGAGQSYYDDSYVKSSLRFSTRFKL